VDGFTLTNEDVAFEKLRDLAQQNRCPPVPTPGKQENGTTKIAYALEADR
jgi:hypothetical protein